MKAKRAFAIFSLAALLLTGCGVTASKEAVSVVEAESFYSDYTVTDQSVTIRCRVSLKNDSGADKTARLSAQFPEDVKSGLLKSAELHAVNAATGEREFFILKGAQASFDVEFLGEFAGTDCKHDRLLPDIGVEIVSSYLLLKLK